MLTVNFTPFPLLQTERLSLRQLTNEDEQALFLLRSDERVMRFLDRPLAASLNEATALLQKINDALLNNDGITWGIALKNDPLLIGTIGYWKMTPEHYRAEIGYLLHPDHQGKGLMQEAITTVLDYGFKTMRLHSIEANVNPVNANSIKILEKNNFIREAWFKENYYYNGKFLDSFIYSLLTPIK